VFYFILTCNQDRIIAVNTIVIGNIELADWTVVIAIDAIICDSFG
jgi:hypothetical protein